MSAPSPQPLTHAERCAVLMPALIETAFDYLVPEGTAEGALVEATLAGRKLVGAVWGQGSEVRSQKSEKEIPLSKLKPISRVIEAVPPLRARYRRWLNWVSEFTLAPKGAVLSLAGLAYAGRKIVKKQAAQAFSITLPTLTLEQQAVADEIARLTDCDAPPPMVIDGITGSGKTEVYFHAIADVIMKSRNLVAPPMEEGQGTAHSVGGEKSQILVLLPEISLTHQWLERFEAAFGTRPVVWHSQLGPSAKARAWQAIARGEVEVVIGARSALFLPFPSLKLIIVDEEHDPSYKQEDGVLYHARDMAVARAKFEQIPILLVSATPSLETLENIREGKYRAAHLSSRYGQARLPMVTLVDLRANPPERGDFISPMVKTAVLETLARGEQVLFFLNRRGYAPLLLCRACGHRFQCADCSAWLVVHGKGAASRSLRCHHCGHTEKFPDHCPACHADAEKLAACGPGVERIAEEVRSLVASRQSPVASKECPDDWGLKTEDWRLVTLSSDESIAPETWAAIEKGEIDILVGTQMVAKGHHFPRLTLVVVVDADVGLDGADLRAGERSYQLLHQLGGRAGRGELAGRVLVQTYNPDHPVMKALVAHDRDRLMALEAKERRAGGWPPFGGLAAILLDGKDEASVRAAGQMLARSAPADPRLRVLGPAPAPLSKLRGQYRYRLLVKAGEGIHLQRTLRSWLAGQKFKGVRVKVDVNPYYFL